MSAEMTGPVQLLLVGFDPEAELKGEILAELARLAERDIVRVLDVLIVRKEDDGRISIVEANEGGIAVALTGLHDEGGEGAPEAAIDADDPDVWYVADAIPVGATAAIALIEHRWAVGLKAAMQSTGGELLAEEWIHPLDLEAVGLQG